MKFKFLQYINKKKYKNTMIWFIKIKKKCNSLASFYVKAILCPNPASLLSSTDFLRYLFSNHSVYTICHKGDKIAFKTRTEY